MNLDLTITVSARAYAEKENDKIYISYYTHDKACIQRKVIGS
jgi:hypothetical protein